MQNPAQAARRLANRWQASQHIDALPEPCRPANRAEGYAVHALWPSLAGRVGGWKIAATSPVFAQRVHANGVSLSLASNRMRFTRSVFAPFFVGARDSD
jgi:2-keto-4-pentenoate hydratase